eukprot:CAMPEP_0114112850 /NCGR_PEP_ID=MMETSP0043_2-20121206/2601_1 /TAXON_ID=464988 /ORGANISM="Hemiselmis andersenii, Strain CCMP644" /LENGTH=145 /DNA_ID=CAMNT_0001204965 /DNA_START=434 /DNA_END=872 /DNA_ORIENTATION=+
MRVNLVHASNGPLNSPSRVKPETEPCDIAGDLALEVWPASQLEERWAGGCLDDDAEEGPEGAVPNVRGGGELLGRLPLRHIRPICLVGDAPRQLERVTNVLVGEAPVLRNALVHVVGNRIHKHHDVALQRLCAVCEAANVAEPKN